MSRTIHATCHEVCDGKILIYIPFKDFAHQDNINDQPPNFRPPPPKRDKSTAQNWTLKTCLNQPKVIQIQMAEQQSTLGEYNAALAEVTRIIREQARLIEDNPSACIEYQRRINRERWNFAEAWNVILKIEVRTFQTEAQSSTPNAANAGRQGQRQILFLPFEAPEIWRNSSDAFREFILSLPHISRDSLGKEQRDKECNICYYPFFASRGKLEAEAIRNGTAPPDMSLQPHEVPFSDLPELPVRLPCGHIFGQICVLKWISGERSGYPPTCPICRAIWMPFGSSQMPPGQVTIVV